MLDRERFRDPSEFELSISKDKSDDPRSAQLQTIDIDCSVLRIYPESGVTSLDEQDRPLDHCELRIGPSHSWTARLGAVISSWTQPSDFQNVNRER
jgi:hypothetical protein